MLRIASTLLIAVLLVAADCIAQTQGSPEDVLVENGSIKLTRADYELELLRMPPGMRAEFAMSPKRLTTTLNQILVDKTLAKEARDNGLDRDPEIAARLAHEIDRFLAEAEVLKIQKDASAYFDAHVSDYLPKARETYLLDKQKYVQPEQVSASHILITTTKRNDAAALALAKETRAKLEAGADFNTLAKEVSDDPTAATNGGSLGWFSGAKMDPAFASAAFGLKNVGDLSEPVLTQFGYHIIRLDGRRPARQQSFDEVSKEILAQLRDRYVKEALDARIEAIRTDPHTKVNQAAIDALVVKEPAVPKLTGPHHPGS
jgi:peptidyl-prolyl cis-trans isomerase C